MVAEDDAADGVFLQVEGDAQERFAARSWKLEQLTVERAREAVNANDAIAGFDDRADVHLLHLTAKLPDLVLDHRGDCFGPYRHALCSLSTIGRRRKD